MNTPRPPTEAWLALRRTMPLYKGHIVNPECMLEPAKRACEDMWLEWAKKTNMTDWDPWLHTLVARRQAEADKARPVPVYKPLVVEKDEDDPVLDDMAEYDAWAKRAIKEINPPKQLEEQVTFFEKPQAPVVRQITPEDEEWV